MTPDRIELDFNLKPRQRARAVEYLNKRIDKRDWGILGYVMGPRLLWILVPLCAFVIVPNLLELIEMNWRGVDPRGFELADLIDGAIGLSLLGYTIKSAWDCLRGLFGKTKPDWIGREGVHWGPVHMAATDDVLVLERAKYRAALRWPAIVDIQEDKRSLFLMLTRASAIIVPKSAFASRADQRSFREFVEQRVAATP